MKPRSEMTNEELIEDFGRLVGEKAGELAADVVAHATMLGALAGPQAKRVMLDIVIERLKSERAKP